MKILVVGSGGREHALTWSLRQSDKVTHIYVAPGNGGTAAIAENVSIDTKDHDAVVSFCKTNEVSLAVIGPEAELVDGLVDSLEAAGIKAFGPNKKQQFLRSRKILPKNFA